MQVKALDRVEAEKAFLAPGTSRVDSCGCCCCSQGLDRALSLVSVVEVVRKIVDWGALSMRRILNRCLVCEGL